MHLYHEGLGQSVNYEVTVVPDSGDGQTEAVVALMTRYAVEDSTSEEIRRDARQALASHPGASKPEAAFWFVKSRLHFVRDEVTAVPFQRGLSAPVVETLIRPRDMSTLCGSDGAGACQRIGDCDDFSMYLASILLAMGVPVKFVTVAASSLSPSEYSHVYVAAYEDGIRMPLDASHGNRPGWETKGYTRIQEWSVGGGSMWLTPAILAIGAYLLCR